MPQVKVVHSTYYRYARPVLFTTHRVMLRPRDSHDLRLRTTALGLTPPASGTRWAHDVFSNSVCYLDWAGVKSDRLDIVSTLEIDHFPAAVESPYGMLDPAADSFPFAYSPQEFPDLAWLIERQYADPDGLVNAWARRFLRRGGGSRTLPLLTAITQAIKADFAYEARDREGTNPPTVTLATRRGACRDFALLMMDAVRSLGLAARFVSGYVYDERTGDATVGGGATHAWCAVYLPGAGWVEFDPTNGLVAGRNLIRVCSARTPEQAVPVAGGFIGRKDDFLGMSVNVEMTVAGVRSVDPQPRGAVPPATPKQAA